MKRSISIFMFAICAFGQTFAQSAEWLVAPEYSAMKYFGPSMYQVKKDGKVGIISTKGKIILQPEYDAINYFYEGKTVFVNKSNGKWLIKGVLDENGNVYYSDGTYYLLPNYMFYSEGFITAEDEYGRYGYLDEKCRPAWEFTDDVVHPFSEGFAVVGSGDTFHWIDTSGEQILPKLKNGGTPYGGTNFYNGKSYLWDEDEVLFVLNGDGRVEKLKSNTNEFDIDYLYRVSGLSNEVSYSTYEQEKNMEWVPEERDGLWTYISEKGKLLTPFQYDKANYFSEGSAVAMMDGKYGLIHIVEDNSSFYTHTEKSNHIFSEGGTCNCEFQLSVPEKWKDQSITVSLKDPDNGNVLRIEKSGENSYSFRYTPNSSLTKETKTFNVEVKNNGIKLWQGNESFSFVQRTKLVSSIRVNNADANSNDRCMVTATIKNPSPIPVTTTITLSGGGSKAHFANITKTITIPARGSKSISSSFLVKNVELNGWCSVSTSDGTSARRSNLELKPF